MVELDITLIACAGATGIKRDFDDGEHNAAITPGFLSISNCAVPEYDRGCGAGVTGGDYLAQCVVLSKASLE